MLLSKDQKSLVFLLFSHDTDLWFSLISWLLSDPSQTDILFYLSKKNCLKCKIRAAYLCHSRWLFSETKQSFEIISFLAYIHSYLSLHEVNFTDLYNIDSTSNLDIGKVPFKNKELEAVQKTSGPSIYQIIC